MALQNIPANLGGFRLMVTEAPAVKMREAKDGTLTPVVDRDTQSEQYVVVLFAKPKPVAGKRAGKGEEIRVNLPGAPADEFEEGDYVELINLVINTYEMRGDDGKISASGMWFKADGLKPVFKSAVTSPAA
jgi:hypothetical protein